MQSIVDRLPEIASAIAAPLAKTERMVFVSSDGNAASKLTGDVATMLVSRGGGAKPEGGIVGAGLGSMSPGRYW